MKQHVRTRGRRLAAAIIVVATTAAVARPTAATSPTNSDEPAAVVDRSAELRYAVPVGVNSWDPHRFVASGDAIFQRQVYDRLLTFVYDEDGNVSLGPQLATSYEVAGDGLSISFELRDGLTFQDGTPLDGDAVRANLERGMDDESTVRADLASLDSVEVVDPTHVVLHLSQPDPSLPWALAFGTSGMMASPAAFDGDLASEPVGSGPFRLVSFEKDGDVVYERWDDYWDPDAAQVARLTITNIPDPSARYNQLQSGDLDIGYMSPPADVESRSLDAEGYHWVQSLSPNVYGIFLNTTTPPMDDVRVRRAVYLAIDRTEISEGLLSDIQPPAWQPFVPGYLGHDPALADDPYDPEEAAALVSEAGADGATIQMIQTSQSPQDSIALVVQEALGEIGLNVELTPLSSTEARATWAEGEYHAMSSIILGQPEPSSTLRLSYLQGGSNLGETPAELTEMVEAGLALPVDSDERAAQYVDIANYLVENPIHIPIAQFSTINVCRPEVVGCDLLLDLGRIEFRGVGITS